MRVKIGDGDLVLIRVNTEAREAAQDIYRKVSEWTKSRGLQEVEIHAYHQANTEQVRDFLEITVFSVNDLFEGQVLNSPEK